MKKAFSKVLVMLLTVCMLVSVLSVGISAGSTTYPYYNGDTNYPVSISISQHSSSPTTLYASVTDLIGTYSSIGSISWSYSDSTGTVSKTTSGKYVTFTTSLPTSVYITVTASLVINGVAVISDSCSVTVYPSSYYSYYYDYPYWWIYDWSDIPYWWMYDWYGTYPYSSNAVYVNGTSYPWCGYESSSSCTSSWCIHDLIKYPSSYITRDTSYCSSSCGYCGNPFNHHSISWFINGGKDTTSSSSSKSTTVTPKEGVKVISAVERLAEFRKNQGKTEETETTETKKTPSKWINLYKDVNLKSWYYDYVRFVSENEYIKGKDTFEFGINTTVSKSEFAEALGKFADVKKDKAADYVKWAVDKGFLVESENNIITKEEAVNAVYKYVVSLDKKVDDGSSKVDYSDADTVNEDYIDAVNWAVSNGLIGISANKINPTDPLVKARFAQLLYNLNIYLG